MVGQTVQVSDVGCHDRGTAFVGLVGDRGDVGEKIECSDL
jgi:hypothetical protein